MHPAPEDPISETRGAAADTPASRPPVVAPWLCQAVTAVGLAAARRI
ncbi:MAG: hypothetical protein R3B95_10760 [Nitrospirales bacterium]|nr:hypothetical protein [Nitrospirales bacterium]